MKTFSYRFKEAMTYAQFLKPNGKPDQARLVRELKDIGVHTTQQTISHLLDPEAGAIGSRNTVSFAKILKVNPDWLATGDGDMIPSGVDKNIKAFNASQSRIIPVINTIPAGGAKTIIDDYAAGSGMDELATDLDVGPYAFALELDGESMQPEFNSGDKVIIDPAVKPRPGDYVAFRCHGDGSTFKKYRPRGIAENGIEIYELVPLNPDYPTLRSDQLECEIIGTMVEHRRYRRR